MWRRLTRLVQSLLSNQKKIEQDIIPLIAPFFAELGNLFSQHCPEQITTVVDFLGKCADTFQRESKRFRENTNKA